MVGVIVYKLLVIHPLYKNPNFQQYAATIVSVTGSMMNLIIIMILSKVSKQIRDVILIYIQMRWGGKSTDSEILLLVYSLLGQSQMILVSMGGCLKEEFINRTERCEKSSPWGLYALWLVIFFFNSVERFLECKRHDLLQKSVQGSEGAEPSFFLVFSKKNWPAIF